jgi:hypothetical protein
VIYRWHTEEGEPTGHVVELDWSRRLAESDVLSMLARAGVVLPLTARVAWTATHWLGCAPLERLPIFNPEIAGLEQSTWIGELVAEASCQN